MISKLFDSNNNLINDNVNEVLPHLDTIKIKNRLLDGTYHIQTVGSPVKQLDVTCTADEAGKTALDEIEAYSSPIILKREGKYYTGLIMEPPQSSIVARGSSSVRQYTCKFKITVNAEGVDG